MVHECKVNIELRNISVKIIELLKKHKLCDKEMLTIIALVQSSILIISMKRFTEEINQMEETLNDFSTIS